MTVQVLQTLARLARHGGDLALRHQVRGDHVRQAAALHVLHDDPEVVLIEEGIDVVDDIWVPRRAHDENLVDDEVLLRLLVKVHLLDRNRDIGAHLVRSVHAAGRPLTNLDKVAVEAGGISVCADLLEARDNGFVLFFIPGLLLSPPWSSLSSFGETGGGGRGLLRLFSLVFSALTTGSRRSSPAGASSDGVTGGIAASCGIGAPNRWL